MEAVVAVASVVVKLEGEDIHRQWFEAFRFRRYDEFAHLFCNFVQCPAHGKALYAVAGNGSRQVFLEVFTFAEL